MNKCSLQIRILYIYIKPRVINYEAFLLRKPLNAQ